MTLYTEGRTPEETAQAIADAIERGDAAAPVSSM
jgi:hypothetical protein